MSTGLTNPEVGELYRRYGYLMLRRTRAIVRDAQLADDVLHSVFLKIMKHGASIRTADSQLAWLYRAVDRCCFDLIHQRRRQRAVSEADLPPEPRPLSTLEERGFLSLLWGKLDTRERAVALLLYSDGLSHEEISRRLGCSRQSISKKATEIRLLALRLARDLDVAK